MKLPAEAIAQAAEWHAVAGGHKNLPHFSLSSGTASGKSGTSLIVTCQRHVLPPDMQADQ